MSEKLITALPHENVALALERMESHHIHRLLIVNERGNLCGVTVRSDCLGCADPSLPIRDIMVSRPATCGPNMPLGAVGMFMRHRRIGGLPVVDDSNQLIGIITESDVLNALASVTSWDQAAQLVCLRLHTWRDDLIPWLIDLAKGLDVQFINILPHNSRNNQLHVSMRLRGDAIPMYLDLLRAHRVQVLLCEDLPGQS